jgi:hypothetical protein
MDHVRPRRALLERAMTDMIDTAADGAPVTVEARHGDITRPTAGDLDGACTRSREDERDYTAAAQMLGALGVDRVALLTNNPDEVDQLSRLGVAVTERVPTGVYLSPANAGYLAAKASPCRRYPRTPARRLTEAT